MKIRYLVCIQAVILIFGISVASRAQAQVHVDGLHLDHASANIGAGYDGEITNDQGSTHDLGVSGNVSSGGYYYNPNFLSLQGSAYYDRAQSNAGETNLDTSKGYNVLGRVFGGSTTPGNVNFAQSWGNSGTYGIEGVSGAGLYSTSNNNDFGIAWQFRQLSFIKNLTLGFSDDKSKMTVPGLDVVNNASRQSYSIGTSGYSFWGFPLSGGYQHLHVNSDSNLYANGGDAIDSSTSMDVFKVMTGHALPYRGSITLSAYRMSSNSTSEGETSHNVSNEFDSSISTRFWRLPLSGSVTYNDNVYGSVLQELNASGQTVQVSDNSPRIGTLMMNVSSSYTFPHHVFVTGFANHQEEYIGSSTVGATSFGANAAYNFSKLLNGLTIIVGMHDSASQVGNTGASMIATVNYTRNFNGWHVYANFNYNQNVQTLLSLYTSSSMASSAAVRRQMRYGLSFGVSGGYSRSVFTNEPGMQNYAENANANITWKRQALTASYAQSGGTAILTSTGLVTVTTPGLVTNTEVPFSGRGYSAGYSTQPLRRLSLNVSWSKFISDSSSSGVLSNVSSQTYTGSMSYLYRKLNFLANATRTDQGANSSALLPSRITVYYFGVTRWFSFF
jgi:hypothetical protein